MKALKEEIGSAEKVKKILDEVQKDVMIESLKHKKTKSNRDNQL